VKHTEEPPSRTLGRPLAVALGALGVFTFIAAVLLFLLAVNARDFCDSTCNQRAAHRWAALSATAAASSLIQVFAAADGSRRLALGAFAVTSLIAAILSVSLIA
jgi:hypothetical protein